MTDVERQALGQTLAGKNQYRVLASVMSNFEHATEATTTALNSQGSAMEENTAYMESLEARTQLIQKDFQDLANHVINSQLVKSVLSLTHELLQLADTGLGRVLIQLTLLGGIGWGGTHLLKASKVFGAFKKDIIALIQPLLNYHAATVAAANGSQAAASALVFMKAQLIETLTILGGFAAVGAVIFGLIKLFDALTTTYEEQKEKLDKLNQEYEKLTGTGSELDTLREKTGRLTTEERERLTVLEAQAAALKQQVDEQAKLTALQWRKDQIGGWMAQAEYEEWERTGGATSLPTVENKTTQTLRELTEGYNNLQGQLEANVITTEEYYKELQLLISAHSDTAEKIKILQDLGIDLQDNEQGVIDLYTFIVTLLSNYSEAQQNANENVEEGQSALQLLVEQLNALKDAFSSLQSAYDDFNDDNKLSYSTITDISDKFSELGEETLDGYIDRLTDANLTSDELNSILSDMTIALAETRIETMGLTQDDQRLVEMMLEEAGIANAAEIAAYLLRDAQVDLTDATNDTTTATDNATGAINNFNNTPVDVSNKIGQVDNLTSAFGRLQQMVVNAHRQINALSGKATLSDFADLSGQNTGVLNNFGKPVVIYNSGGSSTSRGGGGGGSSRSTTEKELTYLEQKEQDLKAIEDGYSNILSLIESEYNLLVDQGAPAEDIIAKAQEYQDQLHKENEELREFLAGIEDIPENQELIKSIQTKINQNSSKWWDWADKIAKRYEDIAEEAQKAAEDSAEAMDKLREAWDKDVDEQKEALEALQEQMEDYYQGQIDDIDAQIDALKATNEELEDQIAYEEKLDAIAQARQKKAMVYKDGRWQYIEDIDAVSSAVKDFEDYQREKQLNDQIAGLQKEKDALELVKKAWSDMTKSVENDKDRWLIAQKLGIDTSTAMWQQYINDMAKFVEQYRNLTFAMNPYGTQQLLGSGGQTLGYTTQTNAGGTVNYTSKNAIDFIEGRSGTEMTGSDGSKWIRMSDGRTLITGADGVTAVVDPTNPNATISSSSSSRVSKSVDKKYSPSTNKKYASGTLSALGGLSLVGEHGAELRVLNSGDGILPADITRNLMAWGQTSPLTYIGNKLGQAMNVTIQALNLPNVVDGQGFVDYVRNNMFGQVLSYVH